MCDSLKDVVHSDNSLYLIFEYLEYDLKKFMQRNGPLTPVQVKVCIYPDQPFRPSRTSCCWEWNIATPTGSCIGTLSRRTC